MRLSRFLLLPFVCLGLMAALTVSSPRAIDYGPLASAYDAYEHVGLTMPALIEHVVIVEEAAATDAPTDAHRVVYEIANQPGSAWRLAVDAYKHIDPGRLAI